MQYKQHNKFLLQATPYTGFQVLQDVMSLIHIEYVGIETMYGK